MIVPTLAWKSLWNRRGMAILTIIAVSISVLLLLGVEKVRTSARASFTNTISSVDLIIGARAGGVQLLLYSVFHIGDATANFTWQTYREIEDLPEVEWMIPISLGDSHQGFRVVGTSSAFFEHYRYRGDRPVEMEQGVPFDDVFDAVVGADVAEELGYEVGQRIIISHGVGSLNLSQHADKPFIISGIMAKTGTPVDRSVLISLEGMEAIHVDWTDGVAPRPGEEIPADVVRQMDLTPTSVTAAMLGLKSRLSIFTVQRLINEYRAEAMSAILPGVSLVELWSILGAAETALIAVSIMVVVTAIIGMVTMTLSTLNERRREMAVLRAVGARPLHIFTLLIAEAGFLAAAGALLGIVLLYIGLAIAQPIIDAQTGLFLPIAAPSGREVAFLAAVVVAGLIAGAIPAFRAYRNSLADGIIVRT